MQSFKGLWLFLKECKFKPVNTRGNHFILIYTLFHLNSYPSITYEKSFHKQKMWKHLKNKESLFKVTHQVPQATLGNRILLNRIPSFGGFLHALNWTNSSVCCSKSSPKHRSCRIGSKKMLEDKKLICTILLSDNMLVYLHS